MECISSLRLVLGCGSCAQVYLSRALNLISHCRENSVTTRVMFKMWTVVTVLSDQVDHSKHPKKLLGFLRLRENPGKLSLKSILQQNRHFVYSVHFWLNM